MKKSLVLAFALAVLVPGMALATSVNGQGTTNGNSATTSSSTSENSQSATQDSSAAVQTETQTQTQTSNPGTGTMTQEQARAEEQIQQEIQQSAPKYAPKNSKGAEQKSAVANAAAELIRTASQIANKGIGDQIRLVAQTQTQNQDKIGESIDKVETRSGFAKFFIGANYKELGVAKSALAENQSQIQELQQIMTQLTTDAEKVAVADQIIALQQTQLELKDQIGDLSSSFSLFGWINRWHNKY